MRAVVEGARGVAIQQSMQAMVSGQESQVLLAQRERQGQMNRDLMWQSAEMQKSLNRAEEEVRAAREQCPVVGMDVDWQTGAPMGGREGGGFSGEGGASMRPLPDWFAGEGTELDRGDSAFGEIPPYSVTDLDKGGPGAAAAILLLLVIIFVLYMAYR